MLHITSAGVLAIAGFNVAALIGSFLGDQAPKSTTGAVSTGSSHTDAVNAASLKSIESSWLKVPAGCKAKGFNAEPVALVTQQPSAQVLAIYQAIQA